MRVRTAGSARELESCEIMLRKAIIRRCVKRKRIPCSVCKGDKVIKSEKRRKLFNQPGLIMPERKYFIISFLFTDRWPEGATIPGPDIASDHSAEDLQPKAGEVSIGSTEMSA